MDGSVTFPSQIFKRLMPFSVITDRIDTIAEMHIKYVSHGERMLYVALDGHLCMIMEVVQDSHPERVAGVHELGSVLNRTEPSQRHVLVVHHHGGQYGQGLPRRVILRLEVERQSIGPAVQHHEVGRSEV